jgi:DNA-binding beta-propeller fold protein YncE
MDIAVNKFDYKFVDSWGKLPLWWKWGNVTDIATDSHGRIFALDRGAHPVIVFDTDGDFISAWGEGVFRVPHGLYIDSQDYVYVADCSTHLVSKFTSDGQLVREWGTRDGPSATFYGEPFSAPTGVAFGPSGRMYVSDGSGNFKVQVFAPDGSFLKSWGKPGTGPSEFAVVHALDVDLDERVYVCDRENRRIQIFDQEGKYLTAWTGLRLPVDVRVKGNLVYVLEEGNDWTPSGIRYGPSGVAIFSRDGNVLARWKEGERST